MLESLSQNSCSRTRRLEPLSWETEAGSRSLPRSAAGEEGGSIAAPVGGRLRSREGLRMCSVLRHHWDWH